MTTLPAIIYYLIKCYISIKKPFKFDNLLEVKTKTISLKIYISYIFEQSLKKNSVNIYTILRKTYSGLPNVFGKYSPGFQNFF